MAANNFKRKKILKMAKGLVLHAEKVRSHGKASRDRESPLVIVFGNGLTVLLLLSFFLLY